MHSRALFAILFAVFSLSALLAGCAHPAPRAIALPTTAAVRAPIVAAQQSQAAAREISRRVQAAIERAKDRGLTPEEARELSPLLQARAAADAQTQDHLSAALYQAGALDRAQIEKQKQIDALEKHDAAQTARAASLARSRTHWELIVLLLLLADLFAGAPIQRAMRAALLALFHGCIGGIRLARIALKTALPTVFFWL